MRAMLKKYWFYFILGLVLLAVVLFEAHGEGDFFIFLSASRDLFLNKNIYTTLYSKWYHYYYDISFALILFPFSFLPLYLVKVFWLILNVFFVYRIWKIINAYLPPLELGKNIKILFILLSFIFVLKCLRDNFHLAQVTIFILYLTLEGLYLMHQEKKIFGSLLLALGITIKLLPIVIIPYLLYRKDWKSAGYTFGFIFLLLFFPALFIGYDYNLLLLKERWMLINPTNQAHILDTSERSFHSLTTLLATLLVENSGDQYALSIKRNIANIPIQKLNLIINITRAFFALLTLYFLRTRPFVNSVSNLQRLYEISYLCLIIPLIFPHQQHYAFFFIFPASTYLLFYYIKIYFNPNEKVFEKYFILKKYTMAIILFIIYFLCNSHFILGAFNHYYDHFKTLTYGVLLMIPLLAYCKPEKLNGQ
jgi:Glycosyltransferase family 87